MLTPLIRMKSVIGALALGTSFAISSSASALDKPVQLTVASFTVGSSAYVYAVTLAELLRPHLPAGSVVDTPPIGGGNANPLLVSQGKADIGMGFTVSNVWARNGVAFYDKPLNNLRGLIGGLDQYYLGIVVNHTDAPDTLEEYLTKNTKPRVMLLRKGSLGAFSGEQLLDMLGANEEAISERGGSFTFTDFENVKSAFASGSGDVFIQLMTRGHAAFTEMAESGKTSFLALTDDSISKMAEKHGWNPAVLPPKVFRGQDKERKLLGMTTSMIVRTEMPDDVAYTIAKAVCENQDSFKAGHAALAEFDCEKTAWREDIIGLPLHDGAARYYRERGWLK